MGDRAKLKAYEHAVEEIRKAVFDEDLTLANLKHRIARILLPFLPETPPNGERGD